MKNDRSNSRSRVTPFGRTLVCALASLALFAQACGLSVTGGIGGTGVSDGAITAFGSIFVNGVEWETAGAQVFVDDVAVGEGELRLGMVVRVEGTRSPDGLSGNATSVTYDDSIEGPIEAAPVLDGTKKTFTIFGQAIVVEEGFTVFDDGATFANLAMDDVVEVSGFVDDTGAIRSTRIELKGSFQANVSLAELKGTISAVDQLDDEFMLGGVLVRYSPGTVFDDLVEADLQDGLLVEVEGVLASTVILDATRIEREDEGLGVEESDDIEIEGFVTNYMSDANFRVSGVVIDASMAMFEPVGGALANGVRVEVEGALAEGVLTARNVELEDEGSGDGSNSARIEAAASADASGGFVTVLGVRVHANGNTRVEDDRDEEPNFRFQDIRGGDWLRIEGAADGTDSILASRIERQETDSDVILRGPVTAFDDTPGARSIDVLGQPMPIDGGTLYFDALGAPTDEAGFFGSIDLDVRVEAVDENAADPGALLEVDELEVED